MRCGKPDCAHSTPGLTFDALQPDCRCCPEDHDHDAAAACDGGHGTCKAIDCAVVTPLGEPCPGDHCGLEQDGCNVCRPLTITIVPGSNMPSVANMRHVAGGV